MVDLQLVKANGWATVVTDVVKEITDHDPLFVDHFLELNKAVFAFEKKKKRKEKKRKKSKRLHWNHQKEKRVKPDTVTAEVRCPDCGKYPSATTKFIGDSKDAVEELGGLLAVSSCCCCSSICQLSHTLTTQPKIRLTSNSQLMTQEKIGLIVQFLLSQFMIFMVIFVLSLTTLLNVVMRFSFLVSFL